MLLAEKLPASVKKPAGFGGLSADWTGLNLSSLQTLAEQPRP
jgi:hypothetical protein